MIPKLIIILDSCESRPDEASGATCARRSYLVETDIEDGEAEVDADCPVLVRAPVVALMENTEMDLDAWLPT